jgi:hypothetical protein
MRVWRWIGWLGVLAVMVYEARAQVDPERRRLVQVGYNAPLEGKAPFAGYAFYYHNEPGFVRPELTLRAAIAPVYGDLELAWRNAVGEVNDLAVGIAGGGYADSYAEIRDGRWIRQESFTGHAGELNASWYHRFNPVEADKPVTSIWEVPLQGVLRGGFRESPFERNGSTAADFVVPDSLRVGYVRAGLRWGGREPVVRPDFAMELSVWYQGSTRFGSERYGYDGDRGVESVTHQFWGRALVAWTWTNSGIHAEFRLTTGTSMNPDRFSAYRLGGTLPMAAEFPLMLPGYYFEELSVRRYVLVDTVWSVPVALGWDLVGFGGTAWMDPLDGFESSGSWHSGVGGGVAWTSSNGGWQWILGYAYGMDAMRSGGKGARNLGLQVQWDLGQRGKPDLPEQERRRTMVRRLNPSSWRGVNQVFR